MPFCGIENPGLVPGIFGLVHFVALEVIPVSAGEVRNFNRSGAVDHRNRAEFGEAAPFGDVIDVQVHGEAVLEAVNNAVVHDEVHAAVAADLLSLFADFLDQRVLIFCDEGVFRRFREEAVGVEVFVVRNAFHFNLLAFDGVALCRVLVREAERAGELVLTAVRLRRHDVVLDFDHLALSGAEERRGVVAVLEVFTGFARGFFNEGLADEGVGVHGDEGCQAVAAVDIHRLADGAESVRCIDVAAVKLVVFQAPAELIFLAGFPVVFPEAAEVVDVSAFAANDFAEEAFLCHVERVELEEVVAAVFELDAVLAGTFRGVDEVPAVLHAHCGRHFDRSVLAVFHRIESDGNVVIPVGRDVNEVHVVTLAEGLVAVFAVVNGGVRKIEVVLLVDVVGTRFFVVAECDDLDIEADVLHVGEAFNGARSAHTQADECDANDVQFRGFESERVFLAFRACGNGGTDDAVATARPLRLELRIDLGVVVAASGLVAAGPCQHCYGGDRQNVISFFHEFLL